MRHASKLKTFTWYAVVTLLVTFAVLVSVVRATIGSVSEYRQHLEDMAGRYLGKPVAIGHMDTRLIGLKPTVVLDDISLLNEESLEPMARFRSVMIALNPLSSLRQLRPIIDLSVHGAYIVVGLREDGTLHIQGVPLATKTSSPSASGALGAWLVGQSRLALIDSTLVWRDMASGDEAVFAGVNLELQNLPNRHRLSGYVKLPKELGKELRLELDIRGDLLTQKDWEGELYVKAVRVHPAPWLQQFDYKGLRLEQGSVDLDIWSRWQGGLLEGVEGKFDLAGLKFSGTEAAQLVQGVAGQVRYEANLDGWKMQLKQLQFEHQGAEGEPLALQLQKNDQGTVFQASALPLGLLHRYAPYLPQLNKVQRDWLLNAAPDGQVSDVHFELAEGGRMRATGAIHGLHLNPWQRFPGVSGLSGHFALDGDAAQLVFDPSDLELSLPKLFRRKLAMQLASGELQLQRQGQQWRVVGNSLQVSNQDIRAEVGFDSWIAPGEAPLISLLAKVRDGRAPAVPGYLPAHIMSAGSVAWLDKAFVDGRIASGRILLHGRLDSFPFRRQQGRFEVLLDAEDVTLHYQEGWPNLAQVAGEVLFDGPGMSIAARRASVFSSRLGMTRVAIDDFKQPVLDVSGTTDAPMNDVIHFLEASPLAKHTGSVLERLKVQGKAQLSLKLAIPLSKTVAQTHPLKVTGQAAFQDAGIQVAEGVNFSAVNGELRFSEKSFEAQEIQAQLYGEPARISVFTEQGGGQLGNVVIAGQGGATAAALQRELDLAILDHLDGASDWQARLTIPRDGNGGAELVVHSTLDGMAVDLPQPAAKGKDGARPLAATIPLGGGKERPYRLAYGDLVRLAWRQQLDPFRLLGATAIFGSRGAPAKAAADAIHFGGSLDQVQFGKWLKLGRELGLPKGSGASLPIELDMQQLHLVSSDTESGGTQLQVSDFPQVVASVNDFAYDDIAFGKLQLKVHPEPKRLLIDTLRINAPTFATVGSGLWEEGGDSRFTGSLSSGDFGRMMQALGFASVISGGKVEANGQFSWPGSPATFSLGKLNGQAHVKIEDGTVKDVNPGAGKLLGLLSIQALPKRLSLDFSDISDKGLQFSKIEGDIRFEAGNAYTQNLHLESIPANMLITGRTGLVQQDFDQLIAVVPNVSDTVSVAGALAWGPQVAAVLLVLQKLFQSNIDAATMTRYELTGSWAAPKLTKLEPLQPSSTIPGL